LKQHMFSILAVALWAPLLVGCSHDASASSPGDDTGHDAASGASANAGRPTIHLDQTSVLTVDGEPIEEKSYRQLVADCHKAGAPTTEIPASDVDKIGRFHLEEWIGTERSARHMESWSQNASGPCRFVLDHKDDTEVAEASGKVTTVDNTAHTIDVQDVGPDMAVGAVPANEGDETDADRATGWHKEADQQANGATCSAWKSDTGEETCVWSGGGKWGYSSKGASALDSNGQSSGSVIALWARPGKGSSWRLDTHSFDLGRPLPDAPFQIPTGLAKKSNN